MMLLNQLQNNDTITYDDFLRALKNDEIDTGKEPIKIGETEITGRFNNKGIVNHDGRKTFTADYRPDVAGEKLMELLEGSEIKYKFTRQHTWLIMLLNWVFPLLLLVGFFYFIFARNLRGGAGGMLMSFGRSRHRLLGKDKAKVTLKKPRKK